MERIAAAAVPKNYRWKLLIYRIGPRFTVTQANTVRRTIRAYVLESQRFLNESLMLRPRRQTTRIA